MTHMTQAAAEEFVAAVLGPGGRLETDRWVRVYYTRLLGGDECLALGRTHLEACTELLRHPLARQAAMAAAAFGGIGLLEASSKPSLLSSDVTALPPSDSTTSR